MVKSRKVSRKSTRRARTGTRKGFVAQTKHHVGRVLKVIRSTAEKAIKFGKGLGKRVLKKTSSVMRNITKKAGRKD